MAGTDAQGSRQGALWVPWMLSLGDVNRIRRVPIQNDPFTFGGKPLRRVQIMGDVVYLSVKPSNTEYMLDDGTGIVLCVEWNGEAGLAGLPPIELGQLVRVTGRLSDYRGGIQVLVNARCMETDPNAEWSTWIEQLRLRRDVYAAKPDS